jgi:hypothetical protein
MHPSGRNTPIAGPLRARAPELGPRPSTQDIDAVGVIIIIIIIIILNLACVNQRLL